MKVYKVVVRRSGKLKSAIGRVENGRKRAELTYSPGKATKPKFGKVFGFRYLKDAKVFMKRLFINGEIWRAKAPDATPIASVASDGFGCYRNFRRFWEGIKTRLMDAPQGTVVCSELTLIEKVR